jgi:hypothetical protein
MRSGKRMTLTSGLSAVSVRARLHLGLADVRRGVEHLALKIGQIHDVGVHQPDSADPGCGQIERGR